MPARQYKPFLFKTTKPLIVYPVKDENPLRTVFENRAAIGEHLQHLYSKHTTDLNQGEYHIVFVWNLENNRMTDVWINHMENWSESGPLVTCLTFRNLDRCHDAGIASGDSLIVLGREEELRRKLPNLDTYLQRKDLPIFPSDMQPEEDF